MTKDEVVKRGRNLVGEEGDNDEFIKTRLKEGSQIYIVLNVLSFPRAKKYNVKV
jgi:hypothetical protein